MVDTSTRCRIFRRRSRIAACRRVPGLRRRAVLFRFDLGFVVARLRFAATPRVEDSCRERSALCSRATADEGGESATDRTEEVTLPGDPSATPNTPASIVAPYRASTINAMTA